MEVVALGAHCDLVTLDEYRARLEAMAAANPRPATLPTEWTFMPYSPTPPEIDESVERQRMQASFDVSEFAELADGRRITLHTERGFTIGALRTVGTNEIQSAWTALTVDDIERDVLTVVLPDDDDGEEHPWEWLAGLIARHGIDVAPEALKHVPYKVELSDRLRARIAS